MLDASDVETFARKLDAPITEEPWRDEWSERIADEWRSGVAVDTGEYRDSIHVTSEGAASDAPHGPFSEYGTVDTRAQPALVPAINSLAGRSAEDLGRRAVRQLTT